MLRSAAIPICREMKTGDPKARNIGCSLGHDRTSIGPKRSFLQLWAQADCHAQQKVFFVGIEYVTPHRGHKHQKDQSAGSDLQEHGRSGPGECQQRRGKSQRKHRSLQCLFGKSAARDKFKFEDREREKRCAEECLHRLRVRRQPRSAAWPYAAGRRPDSRST